MQNLRLSKKYENVGIMKYHLTFNTTAIKFLFAKISL